MNSMQAQAGLMPPQVIFPGQVSAAIAAQGGVGAFGSFFPTQTYQTAIGTPPIFQGPTGVMAPINPSAPYNPYASQNPYAGLSAYGAFQGRPSPFSPYAPNPPPAYGGFQGQGAVHFAPSPPPPAFDTPYGGQLAQAQAAQDRSWLMGQGARSVAARAGADLTAAGAGAMLGRRFGGWGMAAGAVAGFLGAEMSGLGQGAQNLYGSWVGAPRLAEYGAGAGIEHLSRGFVSGGPYLHASGQGFSHHASMEAAQGLTALAGSASFRRETRDRFNQQDLFKITQGAAESGLMTGVGSPDQMTSRVRDVARSLSAFMELAREPDVVRAIQTMGSLRSSGLNLHETMSAVSAGRSFARMAGTSFQGLAELGGSAGSQAFQSMGLTQGLGFQVGMGNYAQAAASINRGTLSPQLAALTGGAQGLGTLNTMFSGALTQLPMVTPGMMSAGGGLSAGAIQGMLSGRSDLFSMTGRGAGVLSGMADRYGVGGLGMAVAMQPMLQDSLGRILQAQGPFAQRNMEDRQVMALARQMGMSGSQGFLTAAQTLGMDRTQALARATEMGSTAYWEGQRAQLGVRQREARAEHDRGMEEDAPGMFGTLYRHTGLGDAARTVGHFGESIGLSMSRGLGGREAQGIYGGGTSEESRRRIRGMYGTREYADYVASLGAPRGGGDAFDRVSMRYARAQASGAGMFSGVSALLQGTGLGRVSVNLRQGRASIGSEGLEEEYRNIQSGAGFANDAVASTEQQRSAAVRDSAALFGGVGGLAAFSGRTSALAQTYGARPNQLAALGGAYSLLPGVGAVAGIAGMLSGTRHITGEEIDSAYRRSMSGRLSDDQIRENLRTRRSDIAAGMREYQEARGMTSEERAAWDATQRSVRPQGGDTETGQAAVRRAARGMFGSHTSQEAIETFQNISGEARGVGREGSARYAETRRITEAMVALNSVSSHGSQTEAAKARAAFDRLASGLSPTESAQILRQVRGMAGRFGENAGTLEVGRGLLEGDPATITNRIRTGETTFDAEAARRRAATGFSAMSRLGGVMGDVLRGVDVNDHAAVQRAVEGMSPAQRARLSREQGGGAGVARALESGGFSAVERMMGDFGARADPERQEWDQQHGTLRKGLEGGAAILGGLLNPFTGARRGGLSDRLRAGAHRFVDALRERSVTSGLVGLSQGEREAALGGRESAATQGEMEGAGLGRAGDALLEASRELKEASENLRNSTVAGALTSLVT